jgi:sugar lactone lactonase YvrE
VFADRGSSSLVRMDMDNFSKETLISGFNEPNGVVVALDGMVYMGGGARRIDRVDPDTGVSETIYSGGETIDGIGFSPDYRTLYFLHEKGTVYQMPIAEDGTVGTATVLTTISSGTVGPGGGLDGLTVDECGNLYVVEMSGNLWRVTPGGQKEKAITITGSTMGPLLNAVNFGSGAGGWKADALYLISMGKGEVYEVEIGVRGTEQPHL